jgi:hypothetical protein
VERHCLPLVEGAAAEAVGGRSVAGEVFGHGCVR